MSYTSTALIYPRITDRPNRRPIRVLHALRVVFITGPRVLLTARISLKCATVMTLLCVPALFFCALLTLPALVFQSPQQKAYYYFARMLEDDPTRWIVMLLVGICVILSLALPATMPAPQDDD